MPKKTNQDQSESSDPKNQLTENNQDSLNQMIEQNNILRELSNLKDQEYYRMRLLSILEKISIELEKMRIIQEDLHPLEDGEDSKWNLTG